MPWMESKFSGKCAECGDGIDKGDQIYYDGVAYCAAEDCGVRAEREDKEKNAKGGRKARLRP